VSQSIRLSKFTLGLSLVLSVAVSVAARAQQCTSAQYGTIDVGNYMLQNDEWNLGAGPGGWQQICAGSAGNNSWSSQWWWPTGSGGIKAYPSIVSGWHYGTWSPNSNGFPVKVSANAPLPTSVSFSISGNNQYDVAYDLFFSSASNPSTPSAELMVWLWYSGNQPAGQLVQSNVTLGGVSGTWDVWSGNVGWPVWTFVPHSQTTSFNSNLQPFVYFVAYSKGWLDKSWYELDTEFGAEIIQSNGQNGGITVNNFRATAY